MVEAVIEKGISAISYYRFFVITNVFLFISTLITPMAEIVFQARDPDSAQYLQFLCVFCQYGGVDPEYGTASSILRFTSFNFYNTWIINLMMVMASITALIYAFPVLRERYPQLDAKRVMYIHWVLAISAAIYRLVLQLLLWNLEAEYEATYPNLLIIGKLSWGMGGIVIGAIFSATVAMMTYILFLYDEDSNVSYKRTNYYLNTEE